MRRVEQSRDELRKKEKEEKEKTRYEKSRVEMSREEKRREGLRVEVIACQQKYFPPSLQICCNVQYVQCKKQTRTTVVDTHGQYGK